MFLQILGIIFLIIICVIAYYAWKMYRYVKKQSESDISVAMSVLPALDMELEPSTREEWIEKEQLSYTESELKKVGSKHIGYYCVYSGYAIIRVSLWNFKDQAAAVIYEASSTLDKNNASFIFEVASQLDIGSICITSNANAVYDSRPENHILSANESNSILDFLKAIKSEIPQDRKLIKIKDVKDFFMELYEDTTEFRWRAEQLNNKKTQQTFSSVGVKVTDELMEELIDLGKSYSIDINVNRARRQLASHSKMSVVQWEKIRDKLIFINEIMQVEHLVEAIYDLAGELTEIQEQTLEGFESTTEKLSDPIGAFQMLIQAMNLKVKRVAQLETPVKTEIFLPLQ